MFDINKRYVTKGVMDSIEVPIQLLLWELIENIEGEVDYLQVFELKQYRENRIKIVHRQEVPNYRREYQIVGRIETELKVFLIDSGSEGSVLMLNHEY